MPARPYRDICPVPWNSRIFLVNLALANDEFGKKNSNFIKCCQISPGSKFVVYIGSTALQPEHILKYTKTPVLIDIQYLPFPKKSVLYVSYIHQVFDGINHIMRYQMVNVIHRVHVRPKVHFICII